ncbi:hypothetical protein FV242_31945 [Methylobacterium sp. WL64]|uniref:hypothetical protein n=1 Tax=Methylobacterium sp. WL64 TaxID=2603894 RepID=UPI0011C99AE7|nr:hypothetical protein [Methylobacterium sp. WL64]TXM97285.1 hypothetical protein FV242_31945 [Methylobacterium sp. WL64]
MAIRFYDSCEVDGESRGKLECPNLRIGQEGFDCGVEVGPRDPSGMDQIADALRRRLSFGH